MTPTSDKLLSGTICLHALNLRTVRIARRSSLQVNQIEQAHRFTRAVSVGNSREFVQAEKQEQEIAEAANG